MSYLPFTLSYPPFTSLPRRRPGYIGCISLAGASTPHDNGSQELDYTDKDTYFAEAANVPGAMYLYPFTQDDGRFLSLVKQVHGMKRLIGDESTIPYEQYRSFKNGVQSLETAYKNQAMKQKARIMTAKATLADAERAAKATLADAERILDSIETQTNSKKNGLQAFQTDSKFLAFVYNGGRGFDFPDECFQEKYIVAHLKNLDSVELTELKPSEVADELGLTAEKINGMGSDQLISILKALSKLGFSKSSSFQVNIKTLRAAKVLREDFRFQVYCNGNYFTVETLADLVKIYLGLMDSDSHKGLFYPMLKRSHHQIVQNWNETSYLSSIGERVQRVEAKWVGDKKVTEPPLIDFEIAYRPIAQSNQQDEEPPIASTEASLRGN